jgi:hypothetical protein
LKISKQISDRYPFTINADQTEIHFTLNQNSLDTSKESTQKKGKREARDENYLSPFDALLTCVYGFAEGTKSTKIS